MATWASTKANLAIVKHEYYFAGMFMPIKAFVSAITSFLSIEIGDQESIVLHYKLGFRTT